MLQPGDVLAGYRIEAVAGVGGMGVVYRAVQTSLDRPVALKVLSSTLVGNRTFRERFRREGRHAAALDHPNIIPVYEAGESNGLMFIAMRLVDGPSLADLIDRRDLTGREALRILGAIASALDAAHDAGLVHRDIKPQNILLTRSGHPYLADFGITKGTDHGGLTHSGDFVGSLNYVAPEQIEGEDVGGASDIYSLAAVLFQALSGAHPYQRDTDAALMHAHLTADPPTFSARGIDAPAELDAVLARGMAKAPGDRFESAGALIAACVAALEGAGDDALTRRPAFPLAPASAPEPAAVPGETTRADALSWVDPPAAAAPISAQPGGTASGDFTTADAHRGPASGPAAAEPSPPRASPRWLWPVAAAALLTVAAVAGFALGQPDAPPPPAKAASPAVSLTHDASWTPATGTVEGVTFTDAVALRSTSGAKLVAGRLEAKPGGFDPLPAALRARLAEGAEHVDIRLGRRTYSLTKGTLKTGDELWAAYSPDAKGWTGIVCAGPGAQTGCPPVAATLTVAGTEAVALGPRPTTIDHLAAALSSLARARTAAEAGLAAKRTTRRASAARALAAAHERAAAAIASAPDDWERRWVSGFTDLSNALRREARAIDQLASAARARSRSRYATARTAIQARERRVADALDHLGRLGYLER